MKSKRLVFLFVVQLMICHQVLVSQVLTISGKVLDDSDKQPLVGVAVKVKETSKSTATNQDGKYSIQASKGEFLVFSFLGMEPVAVIVGSNPIINITMKSSANEIDEIVVVGYSVVKKSDLTGSVQTVKKEELMKSSPVSLEQGFQGRMAGVNVIKNDGAPGGGISVQIRGTNSFMGSTEPLYVIDGVPLTVSNDAETVSFDRNEVTYRNALSFLDPNDIESLEVLKDASATAIYGSRGSNGVVMITTKSGVKGKDKINFVVNT
ncbi:MAG: TonB-dependent receptor plug domain-containing protein, partial [Bacteroidia bacterium]|nr:TonB-dependent receptor plug domain-containing protein [Bacteroidia bacterium]